MKNSLDMLDGPIFRGLVRFSLPLMLSSVLQLLFNAADIIVIGRFGSNNSLAAVGAVAVISGLVAQVFLNLASGATVAAGKCIGAGKSSAVSDALHVSMALAVALGLLGALLLYAAIPFILRAMQTPEEVFGLSLEYMHYLIAGIPAIALYNFCAGILRAKGDTKRPLYFLLASGIINVFLNLFFVLKCKMDIAGVGLATTLSQCVSTALILLCLAREEGEFRLSLKKIRLDKSIARQILAIGLPSALQCFLFTLSNTVIQAAINSFGPAVMAGNAAASNIEGFVWVCMLSLEQAAMSYISQNYGAGNFERIKRTIVQGLVLVAAAGLVLGQLVVLFERELLSIYTANEASIAEGIVRLNLLCGPYLLCGVMDSFSTDLRGLGHSALPSLVVLLGACGTRLLWIFTAFQTPRFHTTHWLLITYPASWSITAAVLLFFLIRVFKQEKARFESLA